MTHQESRARSEGENKKAVSLRYLSFCVPAVVTRLYYQKNMPSVKKFLKIYFIVRKGAPPSVAKQMRGSMTFQIMKGWVKYTMRSAQGSVYPMKDGRVQIELPRHPETGKRQRITRITRGSRKDAEALKIELLAQAGAEGIDSAMTLTEFFHAVFVPKKRKLIEKKRFKQRSLETYQDRFRLYIEKELGRFKLREIDAPRVRRFLDGLDRQTVRVEAYKTLSAVMQAAVYDGKIPSNPLAAVEPPKPDDYEPEVLDIEDIEVYLWHFRETRIEPIVLLALGGAFRRGEMVALDAEDIDLERGEVLIDDSYVVSHEGTLHEDTKNRKARRVHFPAFITERLREVLPSSGPVMQTLKGKRMQPNSVRQLYSRTLAKMPEGVPRISLKNLRHTSLTLAYDSGAELKAIADRAGHSVRVSEKFYVRTKGKRDRDTADKIDQAFVSRA